MNISKTILTIEQFVLNNFKLELNVCFNDIIFFFYKHGTILKIYNRIFFCKFLDIVILCDQSCAFINSKRS